jgi:hypothetical protein
MVLVMFLLSPGGTKADLGADKYDFLGKKQ